jgi:nitrogen regulatory protein PII
MKQVIALIKPYRARAVLEALEAAGIRSASVREVMGFGRQKGRLNRYLGSEYNASFIPKIELILFVPDELVETAIRAVVGHARTGRMGDGKILVLPCHEAEIEW